MPKDDPRIAEVVVWTNGTVMVFDGSGEQMPEYQGMLSEVGRRLDDAFPATRWRCADWQRDFLKRPREAVDVEDDPSRGTPMDWIGSAGGYFAAGLASVAPGDSVFYACQEAREQMQRAGHVPDWLILGEEEWTRLLEEVSALVPNAQAGAVDRLTEFQGMRVARYAVPSHLEVIARAER